MDKVIVVISVVILVALLYIGVTWATTASLIWGLNGLLEVDLNAKFKYIWLLVFLTMGLFAKPTQNGSK